MIGDVKTLHVFSCKFNPVFIFCVTRRSSFSSLFTYPMLPSRAIFFRYKKRKNPTLKANSNLKQSKNKIRMLKEIKMLHNKITEKSKDEEASSSQKATMGKCEGVSELSKLIFFITSLEGTTVTR